MTLIKLLRWSIGQIIILIDYITRPKPMKRSNSQQTKIDQETQQLSLYQFHLCPFCVKVRRMIHRLNLNIELRDAKNNETYRSELNRGGGKIKVPCLRIEKDDKTIEWMYESSLINQYLEEQFN